MVPSPAEHAAHSSRAYYMSARCNTWRGARGGLPGPRLANVWFLIITERGVSEFPIGAHCGYVCELMNRRAEGARNEFVFVAVERRARLALL